MKLARLLNLWAARQRRYAVRRHNAQLAPLTDAEISSIRAYRLTEIELLEYDEQPAGLEALSRWQPPVMPDY